MTALRWGEGGMVEEGEGMLGGVVVDVVVDDDLDRRGVDEGWCGCVEVFKLGIGLMCGSYGFRCVVLYLIADPRCGRREVACRRGVACAYLRIYLLYLVHLSLARGGSLRASERLWGGFFFLKYAKH